MPELSHPVLERVHNLRSPTRVGDRPGSVGRAGKRLPTLAVHVYRNAADRIEPPSVRSS